MKRSILRGFCPALAAAAFLIVVLPPAPCRAALVKFTYDNNANAVQTFNGGGTLTYNHSSGDFNYSTTDATSVFLISNAYPLAKFDISLPFSLSFDVHVDPSTGNLVPGGLGVQLSGAVDIDGDGVDDPPGTTTSQSLLTGTIIAFGTNGPMPPTVDFNGLFKVTGGLLTRQVALTGGGTAAPLFGLGSILGFDLFTEDVTSGILGNFTQNFSSNSVKPFFEGAVPEPGGLVHVLSGAAALGVFALLRWRTAAFRS